VWWDAIDYANGMLVLGHGIGTSGDNVIGGGYSAVATSGSSTAQVNFNGQGSSVTSFQWLTNEWLVGQAGGSSGYSHVDTISSLGQNTLLDFPGLVSGQVTSMAGNSTHIWVATEGASQGFGQNGASSGAGLLQGERQADGTIDWQDGWTMTANSVAKDMELIGTDLYIMETPLSLDCKEARDLLQVSNSTTLQLVSAMANYSEDSLQTSSTLSQKQVQPSTSQPMEALADGIGLLTIGLTRSQQAMASRPMLSKTSKSLALTCGWQPQQGLSKWTPSQTPQRSIRAEQV
jgi:hypothetical protein